MEYYLRFFIYLHLNCIEIPTEITRGGPKSTKNQYFQRNSGALIDHMGIYTVNYCIIFI